MLADLTNSGEDLRLCILFSTEQCPDCKIKNFNKNKLSAVHNNHNNNNNNNNNNMEDFLVHPKFSNPRILMKKGINKNKEVMEENPKKDEIFVENGLNKSTHIHCPEVLTAVMNLFSGVGRWQIWSQALRVLQAIAWNVKIEELDK